MVALIGLAWSAAAPSAPLVLQADAPKQAVVDEVIAGIKARTKPAIASFGVGAVSVVLALGKEHYLAAQAVDGPPVLALFLTRAEFEAIPQRRKAVAIYHEPDPGIQAGLASKALGEGARVGLILGPESRLQRAGLERALGFAGVRPLVFEAESVREIGDALDAMQRCAAVLAVPDSVIFAPENAKTLILGLYRRNIPLIGFNRGYVTAGAVFSAVTSPGSLSNDVASLLAEWSAKGEVPASRYVSSATVAINAPVARSLGVDVSGLELTP